MKCRWEKFDAGLAAAMSDAEPGEKFLVSVRSARTLTGEEIAEFLRLGGVGAGAGLPTMTANPSRSQVRELSKKDWVASMSLARRLNYGV